MLSTDDIFEISTSRDLHIISREIEIEIMSVTFHLSTHLETTISLGYFFKENPMVPVPERHPAGVRSLPY